MLYSVAFVFCALFCIRFFLSSPAYNLFTQYSNKKPVNHQLLATESTAHSATAGKVGMQTRPSVSESETDGRDADSISNFSLACWGNPLLQPLPFSVRSVAVWAHGI